MFDWFDKKKSQPEVSPGGSILNRHTKLSAPEIGFGVDAVLDLFTKHQHSYVFNRNRPSYV
jgi:hypothetical protein